MANADLAIIITAKDQASAVIAGVNKEVSGFGSVVQGVAGAAMTALAAAAAGVGAGLVASVAAAADFEKQMSAIKAVSGATSSEMSTLQKLALDLGKATSFSASEAAQGIGELIKAGVSIADVMGGGAQAALDLAAAGAIEVKDAAEIAANALNAFGLAGEDMAHVADMIAGAANASAIDVNDFKFSLAAVGAVANAVGMSFDDTAVAIAALGNAGIKGADAGTSLKTMLMGLQPQSKAQIALFRELGIVTAEGANQFFTAEGKMRPLAEVADVLQTALKGMTEQQKLAALEVMFGSDAIRAAAVIAKEGATGITELAEAMGKVTAQQVAQERLNNLAGAFEQLKGSLQTAAITLGTELLPVLTELTKWATGAVNDLIPTMEHIGKSIAELFKSEQSAEVKAFLAELSETTRVTLEAIALLWTQHGEAIQSGWAQTLAQLKLNTTTGLSDLLAVVRIAANSVKGDWEAVWNDLLLIDQNAQARRVAQAEQHAPMLIAIFDQLFTDITAAVAEGWAQITEAWTAATTAISEATTDGFTEVSALIGGIMPAIQAAIMDVWNQIPEDIRADLVLIANHLVAAGAEWLQTVTTATLGMLQAIVQWIDETVAAITTWATSTFLAPIQGLVGTASAEAANVGSGILEEIQAGLDSAVSAVSTWAEDVLEKITTLASDIAEEAADIGEAISNGIASGISSAASAIKDAALEAARAALRAAKRSLGIDSPSKVFEVEVGRPIVEGVISGVKGMARPLGATMETLVRPPLVPSFAGAATGAAAPATMGAASAGGPLEVHVFLGNREFEDIWVETHNNARRRGRV